MAVELRGGCDSRNGHGLEKELEGLVKSRKQILQDRAWDSVWARCFVVRSTPEILMHDSRGDASRNH